MRIVEVPIQQLKQAPWNPNRMDDRMITRLKESIRRYGLVENLVVRPMPDKAYEVIGGNWRLKVLSEMDIDPVPCVVVTLDDGHARLLAQALNHIEGEDDLALRAELLRKVLEEIPQGEISSILPETANSLRELASIGEEDMAAHLRNWQQAQSARLRHLQFQLTQNQLKVVEEVLEQVMAGVTKTPDNPNRRGLALYQLCRNYLERKGGV